MVNKVNFVGFIGSIAAPGQRRHDVQPYA